MTDSRFKEPDGSHRRVRAKVECQSGHLHEVCIPVERGVPPDLRCSDEQPKGYVALGNGSGCKIPHGDLQALAMRELRENLQESLRRGWIQIDA